MKILFFGDVIGRAGREGLARALPRLRAEHAPEFIIVNAENAAHGKGLTPRVAEELWSLGIDVLTMGNHTFDRKEIMSIIDDPRLLRPANYPVGVLGRGAGIYTSRKGVAVGVIQVMGRVNMPLSDCPFQAADREIALMKDKAKVILMDLHVEATSEKAALGWHVAGRASAAIGTHTHVQTADERILPGGTAFLSDAGACGPRDSVIGMKIASAIERFRTGLHVPFSVGTGDALVCGCALDIDETTGLAHAITRFQELIPLDPVLFEEK